MSAVRILVVDDNAINLRLVSDVLEFEGYEILKAVDADQALSIIEHSSLDLILMDIALPGMDGLTLTRQLKADPKTRDIKVVALTAFAMKGDEQKARDAGCDGYITKPIDTRKLAEQVADALGRPKVELPETNINILIIEDQPSELKLIHHVLSDAGHNVSDAHAAESAFAAIALNKPSVIMLDLSLPGMDGLSLARKLKADPATRDIQLIAVTSYPERFTKKDALESGCDAYLVKPLSSRTLPRQVSEVVNRDNSTQSHD